MKPLRFSFFAAIASSASAYSDPYNHVWIAPGPDDQRSPCPGLNTLANHGYLPRSGQNFTIPDVMDAALEAFNVNWDTILIAAKFGLLTQNNVESELTMSLGPLSLHNAVEHDASLSRNDFGDGTGDNVHFNETVFAMLANANPGVNFYNASSAAAVQFARLADSIATNPFIVNTQKEFVLRSRESGLYLSIFGNPLTGVAPKNFVQIFFREERLPIKEGWTKPTTLITSDTLAPIETIVRAESNWTATTTCGPLVLAPGLTVNQAKLAL
ncbi:Cloroperoxidase [Mycena latifolia]|nr:Cloroperoxidase [Mycena latifolia]